MISTYLGPACQRRFWRGRHRPFAVAPLDGESVRAGGVHASLREDVLKAGATAMVRNLAQSSKAALAARTAARGHNPS